MQLDGVHKGREPCSKGRIMNEIYCKELNGNIDRKGLVAEDTTMIKET